ncbi:MAG: dTDP-4-dehydrorhamnose 3,5-epimerase [Candidatus Hydrogenedentota bacterium]
MPMPVDFTPTEIEGVLEVHTKRFSDERGFFSEAYSQKIWSEAGFTELFVQDCLSKSAKGVLRGMHYQLAPHGMGKLVRVISGAIFDVGIDLRRESPTFGKWVGRELTADNNVALYFPPSFAHGFVALANDTLVYYKCTNIHTPEAERAIFYEDPDVGIDWPLQPSIVSQKDKEAPLFQEAEYNF